MDTAIWVEFEDSSLNRYVHVDDVIEVEAPFEDRHGNVLFESEDDALFWGVLAQAEIAKVEYYWPGRVESTATVRVLARKTRRENALIAWLKGDTNINCPVAHSVNVG